MLHLGKGDAQARHWQALQPEGDAAPHVESESPPDSADETPEADIFWDGGAPVVSTHDGLTWAIVGFFGVILFVAIVFLCSVNYARKETVEGVIHPVEGASQLMPLRPGIVTAVHVVEGQRVRANDPVVTLSLDVTTSDGRHVGDFLNESIVGQMSALTRRGEAQRRRNNSLDEDVETRLRGSREQLAFLETQRDIAVNRVELAQRTNDAYESLHERGFVSDIQYRQRAEVLLQARGALNQVEMQINEAQTRLTQLRAEKQRLNAEREEAEAALDGQSSELFGQQASVMAQREIVVRADRDGQIAALQGHVGSMAAPGTAIATLLPTQGGLEAVLWASSRGVGFVRPGNRVYLMYDAFPFQRFGLAEGTVVEVANAPVDAATVGAPPQGSPQVYPVRVRLSRQSVDGYGREWPLVSGMRLRADVVLEERSLITWLLDPILAIRERRMVRPQ